jgi:PAS domain-containing protein
MSEFIQKIDENGITHYVNPKFEKVFDGTEVRESTTPIIAPTEEEIQQYESYQKTLSAKKYLSETDWYVTRRAETEAAIPEEVLTKRAQARVDISNNTTT